MPQLWCTLLLGHFSRPLHFGRLYSALCPIYNAAVKVSLQLCTSVHGSPPTSRWSSSSISGSCLWLIGAVSGVIWASYYIVEEKREQSLKASLSVYQSIYILTLSYGHELWVLLKRMRSWIQETQMSFLCRMAALMLRESKELRHPKGVWVRTAAPSCGPSGKDASYMFLFRGFPGMPTEKRPQAHAGGIIYPA